ncbi:hypothetical protein [Longimicrobium terrae]|uniref:DUF5723 domain-containing protein n=1 Tax=Longimicrobium terrae TaxID=1639882 RepID=A0A841H685_9BACT|nr:hypothetical protein [Longimicrobium terrae]MBB4639164.1 hypothetical protein [Longimicrobium terrae]MBB6073432.1 hypothetical protein [Longimicrobium terrae]NNC32580.1 hypothetical protein [Longimicrobium terrae]
MKYSFRPALALALCAALAPAAALAQDTEAWVLRRGMVEVSASGVFTHHDRLLGEGNPGLGSAFAAPFGELAARATADSLARLDPRLRALFSTLEGAASRPLSEGLTVGETTFRTRVTQRRIPFTLRYGLRDRLTVFATVPLERRGTSSLGPYLVDGNVGLNPNVAVNTAALDSIGGGFADVGRSTLLPLRGSPTGDSLQALLRAMDEDTLILPTRPLSFADILGNPVLNGRLAAEEVAAFDSLSGSRGYQLGDVEVGARLLLREGPPGWPNPDTVSAIGVRSTVGVRGRLPTGQSAQTALTELVPGGGHFGIGVDLLNDVFVSSRWMVNTVVTADVLFPADVQRYAFTATRPFPADTAIRTLQRSPGSRVSLQLLPRWRLTQQISFAGQYAFTRMGETTYSGADVLASPLESVGAWTAHAAGLNARYSSLRAYALGKAKVPFEVDLGWQRTFAGGGLAPQTGQIRVTGRFFPTRALLPRDTPPPPLPADTTADSTAPVVTPPATPLPAPSIDPAAPPLTTPRPVVVPPAETPRPARPPR